MKNHIDEAVKVMQDFKYLNTKEEKIGAMAMEIAELREKITDLEEEKNDLEDLYNCY